MNDSLKGTWFAGWKSKAKNYSAWLEIDITLAFMNKYPTCWHLQLKQKKLEGMSKCY